MLVAVIAISTLALALGLLLGFSSIRFRVEDNPITEKLNALLPQTQCGQCSQPGCRTYAEAIVRGEAEINGCPPGGESTMLAIADLMGVDPVPMDCTEEEEKPIALAVIDEHECIGCTLCIKSCPVDAILGATRLMHTVIANECTGCEKCVEPCPVDCIHMEPIPVNIGNWTYPFPSTNLPVHDAMAKHPAG